LKQTSNNISRPKVETLKADGMSSVASVTVQPESLTASTAVNVTQPTVSSETTATNTSTTQYSNYFTAAHHDSKTTTSHPRDPRSWSVAEVTEWLQSKNAADHIIQSFKNEAVSGEALMDLTKDDMGSMGIRLYGDRFAVSKLIKELKAEWMIADETVGVGSSASPMMEGGKGAPPTYAPPGYNDV
jgi:hypothetical protein